MPAKNRLQMLTEKFDVMFNDQEFTDPIDFPSYKEKYESAREKSGETEGVVCGRGTIGGNDTCIFIMEPNFMMGSMGTVVGDRITALFEYATKNRLPVIGYTVSGGARMQEGALSLMQMAKVSAAAKRHSDAGLLYVFPGEYAIIRIDSVFLLQQEIISRRIKDPRLIFSRWKIQRKS